MLTIIADGPARGTDEGSTPLRYHRPAMEQLQGRTAVVTGAASGIGLAVAEAFVDAGMRVVMADVDEDNLRSHAARLADRGGEVLAVTADVRDPDAVERVGAAAVEHFGKLHVAVNNAGVVNGGYSWEISLEDWHRVLDIDLWGVIHGIRSFVPRILASEEEGHVVNTASMAAVLSLGRLGPYTVAKHGVLGLSDVLRAELASLAGTDRGQRGHARHDQDRHEPHRHGLVRHGGRQRAGRHAAPAQLRLHR